MDTRSALQAMNVRDLTEEQRHKFDTDGYFVLENVYTPQECEEMAAEFDRMLADDGENAGMEVSLEGEDGRLYNPDEGREAGLKIGSTRISNIFNKSRAFDRCLNIGPLLAASAHLLGEIKLHGANLREPHKGYGQQPLHSDVQKRFKGDWWLVNSAHMFDDMTLDNGPTRIVPGSQHWPELNVPGENVMPSEVTDPDLLNFEGMPEDALAPYPGEVMITIPAGSVAVFNSSNWHGGTQNRSGARRRMLHLTYTRRDLKQQLPQQEYLTQDLYERLDEPQRWLFDVVAPTVSEHA
ncbi:phytanoyl-CoA dioxygenase family protein [Bauldia litoralis]|uniref:phytanoyl-CoA dioxygenase family protein n=1 Tax=Bauldia litoralis TaxID=665467 RepID=UPI003265395A